MMPDDAPDLPGWVMVSDAAEELGVSRQYIYRLVSEGRFYSLHKLGNKPTLFLTTAEVKKFAEDRVQALADLEAKRANPKAHRNDPPPDPARLNVPTPKRGRKKSKQLKKQFAAAE